MSYQTRNIITLSVLLLLVLAISGYWIFISYPNEIKVAMGVLDKSTKLIDQRREMDDDLRRVQGILKESAAKLANLDKQIVSRVSPQDTYRYLNEILRRIGILDFDMQFTGARTFDNFGYNIYRLSGEGDFSKIFHFVYYLENGPFIYKVRNLSLRGVESGSSAALAMPFDVEIWAYFATVDELPSIQRTLNDVSQPRIGNPFKPIIKRSLPANTRGLIEVERAALRAIVPGKAIIADHKGNIHAIREGDEVYLGYLTRINPEMGTCEFSLNKGGAARRFVLKLKF